MDESTKREIEFALLIELATSVRFELATETGMIEVAQVRYWLQDKAFTLRYRD